MADLKTSLNNHSSKLNDPDMRWWYFLKDFRSEILENSSIIVLSDYEQTVFKYRLLDFLVSKSIQRDLVQIVVWLNEMKSSSRFVDIEQIIIPSREHLSKLRSLYDSQNTV